MSGTYVAKPAAVVTPDVPPEWNPIWPFPGAYPPGYTPVYSIAVSGPTTTSVANGISIDSILHDHDTYKTNKPSGDSEVIFTAFVGGAPRKLRFSGDAAYANVIFSAYSNVGGDFWGTDSSIDVDIDLEEDNGKALTIVGAGVVEGQIVTDTASMEIANKVWTFELDAIWAMEPAITGVMISVDRDILNSVTSRFTTGEGIVNTVLGDSKSFVVNSVNGSLSLEELPVSSKGLTRLRYSHTQSYPWTDLITWRLRTYLNGELVTTKVWPHRASGCSGELGSFDSRDGAVIWRK